jgi:hypothetical protein
MTGIPECAEKLKRELFDWVTTTVQGRSYKNMVPYQGYEYQIKVTVWIALSLMIDFQCAESLTVEPVSGEDVAAELNVDAEKAVSQVGFAIDSYSLDIQIKRKTTGAWSVRQVGHMVRGENSDPNTILKRTWPITLNITVGQSHWVNVSEPRC